MKEYKLFIDESGNSDPNNKFSNPYILCGCAVLEHERKEIKILADQIKFKYWGKTNIVFHSREIARNEGNFSIFKDKPDLKEEFLGDLFTFLKRISSIVFVIIVDKDLARKKGWNQNKIVKETTNHLIYHFIAFLLSKSELKGKIVIESATAQKDAYFLRAFSYFLSPGFIELSVTYEEIRKILTSLSFVTKDNLDIEEQIADLLAYGAKCKFNKEKNDIKFLKGSYEEEIINILKNKLFVKPTKAKAGKMKFYEKIDSFCLLPKT